jgi:hypothetical protein
MRFKFTNGMNVPEFLALLEKTLRKHEITLIPGCNLYIGRGTEIVTVKMGKKDRIFEIIEATQAQMEAIAFEQE